MVRFIAQFFQRTGERTFQKTLDRERSVVREAAEQERSGEWAKSAAQSPLTPNIEDNTLELC